jgi:hypothetical protein
MPVSNPQRDYSFPWTNDWQNRGCLRATVETPGTVYDDSAAAVNLFVMHNRMHDFSYYLGFTEQNWNAQSSNFGNTETWQEGDPLIGNAVRRPDRHADNANMARCPTALVDHEHVHVAADRGLVLRTLRRRRLRPGRDRPRVRPHDREPHDRQGGLS